MINFTTIIERLSDDVLFILTTLGYTPHKYKSMQKTGLYKFTIRLSKDTEKLIKEIKLSKKKICAD
jgi:ketopantoate hydroxymethyltransferase